MKKIFAFLFLVLCFVSFGNEVLFRLDMKDEFLSSIAAKKRYTLQSVDGKNCLYIRGGQTFEFKLPEELTQFEGEYLRITYRYKLKNVPKPAKPHLGFKVMASYKYDGKAHVGHTASPFGTKDWTWEGFNFLIQKNANNIKLQITLPKGEAWISDLTISFKNK